MAGANDPEEDQENDEDSDEEITVSGRKMYLRSDAWLHTRSLRSRSYHNPTGYTDLFV